VGLPLLWTMEVWEDGAVLPPERVLVLFAMGFGIVVAFNAFAGFRADRTWTELLVDAVQGMGLSVAIAAGALLLLGRLGPSLGPEVMAGRVALEAIPVGFGTALAATIMRESGGDDAEASPADASPAAASPAGGAHGPFARLLVAAAGALYFALNIAPTDEVRIVASEASPPLLLAIVAVSLVMGLGMVFHAEFRGGRAAVAGDGPLDSPLGETLAAYVVSLLVSLVLLWAFASIDGLGWEAIAAQVVMLGFVATFGAAAARLLLAGGGGDDEQGAAGTA